MTRKDYVLIAEAMRNASPPHVLGTDAYTCWFACVCNLAHKLCADNARFDVPTFLNACDTRKGEPLPATWRGIRVVDGDESDLRFLDDPCVIVGLRAKGKAKGDASGFVQVTGGAA